MGEVVDLSKFGEVEESSKKEINDAAIDNAAELLRTGKKRGTIKSLLRGQGYSFQDTEKIVSRAEAIVYAKPKKKINFPLIFLAFVAVLVLIAAASFAAFALSGEQDCGDDTFCVQKTIDCVEGRHKSSYRGMAYSYEITNQGTYCQVFVKALESSNPAIKPGLTMNCLYPLSDGKADLSSPSCDGSLAGLL
ncbi:MAG: hypothetical protein KAW41_03715 [Candidatus Diapherotrites archaeon]|nr:hypothetical protein [Candidatus Diapherotrites archaeon]